MTPRLPSRLRVAALCAATLLLLSAFVVLPELLLGSPDAVPTPLARELAAFWSRGDGTISGPLAELVDMWFRWHLLKALICAALLSAGILLARSLWSRYTADDLRSRGGTAIAATLASLVSVAVAGLLVLNLQASSAPLAALLPLVPVSADDPAVTESLAQLRSSLSAVTAEDGQGGAAQLLFAEVARYTWVNAACAIIVAALLVTLGVRCIRSRSRAGRHHLIACTTIAVLALTSAAGFLAVGGLSALSALDPAAATLGLLGA